jgi:ADP-ribose pyrophosphatase YjhB (NUDIX family)
MSYVGSYIWKLRQKAGDMPIITATVDVLPLKDGKVKLVYAPHVGGWTCIGGHVEFGSSWSSAALAELEEEGGIIANEENLVPFGAISGPERVFHYQDGDAQPFTMCFLVKEWTEEGDQTDKEEVTKTGWFDIDEALAMEITPWCRNILLGCKRYLETGTFQMIEDRRT